MTAPTLVVIDDEEPICNMMRRVFGRREVVTYNSAEDFLAHFKKADRPHLLIVDKNLPGRNGLELVEEHREAATSEFEAVLITGYADKASAITAMQIGIYSYIRKPFQVEDIVYAVAGAEERLRLRVKLRETEEKLCLEEQQLGAAVGDLAQGMRQGKLEQAMEERLASLEQVASLVANELEASVLGKEAEVLSGIIPALELAAEALEARDMHDSREQIVDATTIFQHHLEELHQLAVDLRSLSSSSAGPIDLVDIVRIACRVVRSRIDRSADLRINIPAEALNIFGSASRLTQVVINLLLNAAEAFDGEGTGRGLIEIDIQKDSSDGAVLLLIQDNGRGIAEDRLERVFDPFFGDKKQGKGIGLSIVRNVICEHQGTIQLESVEGEGTTITVKLPSGNRSGTLLGTRAVKDSSG